MLNSRTLLKINSRHSSTPKTPTVSSFIFRVLVKYLGLVTLKEILEKDKELIYQYKTFVVACFNAEDPSIKNRALEIIKVTVSTIGLILDRL